MKKITLMILTIIVVCVTVTFIIVATNGVKTSAKADTHMVENTVYENAYITNSDEGKIRFIWNNNDYEVAGFVKENLEGISDIDVVEGKIVKIRYKGDFVEGNLLSYNRTANQIEIEGYGYVDTFEVVPVYSNIDGTISEISWDELVLGGTKLRYVLEGDKVCAAILTQKTDNSNIRVLLKTGEAYLYDNVYVKSDNNCTIFNQNTNETTGVAGGTVIDVSTLGIENGDTRIITPEGGTFCYSINGTDYSEHGFEGSLIVRNTGDGYALINVLAVENYVKYVLPSEMMLSFAPEALKAQAICARTYAYSQMKNMEYAEFGANLDNTTAYQVYNASGRFEQTDAACDATQGQVVTYDNRLAVCYYFSTCGDMTEDFEVWESETPGYIHKVASSDTNSPFYRWSAELDLDAISDAELGKLKSISIDETSENGFVLKLTAEYENGKTELKNENLIRKFLGQALKSTTLNDGSVRENLSMIPSACFHIVSCDASRYTIEGSGFGHQIGMSQYGANNMAQNGSLCNDIICYYYNNVEIKQIGEIN